MTRERYAYGFLSEDEPNTGVHSIHSVEWIYDELIDGIDLDYMSARQELLDRGFDDDAIDIELQYLEQGTTLIGSWKQNSEGLWEPDKDNGDYAAIVRESVVQVVWSKYIVLSHYCSPCYPSQCDVETPGKYPAYTLPVDLLGESGKHIAERII